MSYYLEMFFAYGSYLLQLVCLACCGLACWRLSKVLGERSFALAAIAIGIFVGLHVLLTMVQYLGGFIPADIWARLYQATFLLYYSVSIFEILFWALFVVGVVRCGLRAKRAAVREAPQD